MNPVGELDAPGVEGADYQLPAAAAFRHTFLPVPFLTTFRSFFKPFTTFRIGKDTGGT